jgi:hypothetical protein
MLLLGAFAMVAVAWPTTPAAASGDYRQVVDLTFPVPAGSYTSYRNDFYDGRSNGRTHRATDIMAPHGVPVHAAVGGTITFIPGADGTARHPSGWMIYIAGDDGRTYVYIHLGRDDGTASGAYAPGMGRGVRVERGQHIGYVGSSGNASPSAPHLHFEIHDRSVSEPTQRAGTDPRINPYFSLRDAEARGDFPCRASGRFVDVCDSNPHKSNIEVAARSSITTGCGPENRFCPRRAVTRGQMAAFLVRTFSLPPGEGRTFADVPRNYSFADDIDRIASAGITAGCDETGTNFCPGEPVSRAQMASFLAAAKGLSLGEPTTRFRDVQDGSSHAAAIEAIAAAGVTDGCASGRYCPNDSVRRDQMASFLVRSR